MPLSFLLEINNMENNEFDAEYLKKAMESIQNNFQSIIAETETVKQSVENNNSTAEVSENEVEELLENNSYSITIHFDDSNSSKEILLKLAKMSLIAKCPISDIAKGIIVEHTIY